MTSYFPFGITPTARKSVRGLFGDYNIYNTLFWYIMVVIVHITQAQAATILNAVFTIIQYTFGLAIVVLLVYLMYNINSAIAWSGVTRTLHSSLWPILLRTDSTSSGDGWSRISIISRLGILGVLLVSIAGVVTPLGLNEGPPVPTDYVSMGASYVADVSPIGRATSPRDKFGYSRICGAFGPVPCPGNGLNGNTSQIAPHTFETFNSTPYGPFNMQFRRYYQGTGGYNYSMSVASLNTLESLILRNDMFAVEGLIVDLTKKPGIGLWNHTLPTLQQGGVWSEDVLWLEPASACVNTNLTIDYQQKDNYSTESVSTFNLTDRGGLVGLTTVYPPLSRDGQNINLYEHAYKAAVLSNRYRLRSFNNMTRNESYVGRAFPSNSSAHSWPSVGKMQSLSLGSFLNQNITSDMDPALFNATKELDILCQGYGGADIANITNVGVQCSLLLGPPYRTDDGDPRLPGDNTTWTQTLHVCVATTRARMQRIDFSFNGNATIDNLRFSRKDISTPVLWAVEETNLTLADVNIFWGRVADAYENDPSLSTIRSEVFYLPADYWGIPSSGNPSTVPAAVWDKVFSGLSLVHHEPDYTASTNYGLLLKWQSLIVADPENSPTQILNMIWTDIVANNLVGTNTATALNVAPYIPSVAYDPKYGIPALLFMCIWLPFFLIAMFILLSGGLKISYLRHLLNQTSLGRVLMGDSSIRAGPFDTHGDTAGNHQLQPVPRRETGYTATSHLDTKDWSKTVGQTPVAFGPINPIAESTFHDSPALGAEGAGEHSIMLTTMNGDLSRKRRTLRASIRENVQPSHSYAGTYPESPKTETVM